MFFNVNKPRGRFYCPPKSGAPGLNVGNCTVFTLDLMLKDHTFRTQVIEGNGKNNKSVLNMKCTLYFPISQYTLNPFLLSVIILFQKPSRTLQM